MSYISQLKFQHPFFIIFETSFFFHLNCLVAHAFHQQPQLKIVQLLGYLRLQPLPHLRPILNFIEFSGLCWVFSRQVSKSLLMISHRMALPVLRHW
jgi:hypothetical protein